MSIHKVNGIMRFRGGERKGEARKKEGMGREKGGREEEKGRERGWERNRENNAACNYCRMCCVV